MPSWGVAIRHRPPLHVDGHPEACANLEQNGAGGFPAHDIMVMYKAAGAPVFQIPWSRRTLGAGRPCYNTGLPRQRR